MRRIAGTIQTRLAIVLVMAAVLAAGVLAGLAIAGMGDALHTYAATVDPAQAQGHMRSCA
jgi:Mg2+/citrate symporter